MPHTCCRLPLRRLAPENSHPQSSQPALPLRWPPQREQIIQFARGEMASSGDPRAVQNGRSVRLLWFLPWTHRVMAAGG
jgi:hypothetical protein